MFEPAVCNGAKKLGLQKEITEASGMYSDITALFVGSSSSDCEVALFGLAVRGTSVGCGSGGLVGVEFLVRVVDEIFLVRSHRNEWV